MNLPNKLTLLRIIMILPFLLSKACGGSKLIRQPPLKVHIKT